MSNFADLVRDTSTTTGTGTLTLANSAPLGCQTVAQAYAVGTTNIPYRIADRITGAFEGGRGTLLSTTTFSRDVVVSSSNNGALLTLTAGIKDFIIDASAIDLGVTRPFSTTISFVGQVDMGEVNVSPGMTFTANNAGASSGACTIVAVIANGTDTIAFTGMTRHGSSEDFDPTGNSSQGAKALVAMFRIGSTNYWSISYDDAHAMFPHVSATPVAPAFSGAPAIIGTPTVGVACAYTPGTVTGSPTPTITQQWTLDGTDISGATGSTYTPITGDISHLLRVREIASNTAGNANSTSASGTVAAAGSVPVNSVVPTITGTAQVGATLTASTGTWSNSPTSYAYQWKGNGTNISGATSSTYVPVTGDIGHTITVSVVASNGSGAGTAATSSATSAVIAASSGPTQIIRLGNLVGGTTESGNGTAGWGYDGGASANFSAQYANTPNIKLPAGTSGKIRATVANQNAGVWYSLLGLNTSSAPTHGFSGTAYAIDTASSTFRATNLGGTSVATGGSPASGNLVEIDIDVVAHTVTYLYSQDGGTTWTTLTTLTGQTSIPDLYPCVACQNAGGMDSLHGSGMS